MVRDAEAKAHEQRSAQLPQELAALYTPLSSKSFRSQFDFLPFCGGAGDTARGGVALGGNLLVMGFGEGDRLGDTARAGVALCGGPVIGFGDVDRFGGCTGLPFPGICDRIGGVGEGERPATGAGTNTAGMGAEEGPREGKNGT